MTISHRSHRPTSLFRLNARRIEEMRESAVWPKGVLIPAWESRWQCRNRLDSQGVLLLLRLSKGGKIDEVWMRLTIRKILKTHLTPNPLLKQGEWLKTKYTNKIISFPINFIQTSASYWISHFIKNINQVVTKCRASKINRTMVEIVNWQAAIVLLFVETQWSIPMGRESSEFPGLFAYF